MPGLEVSTSVGEGVDPASSTQRCNPVLSTRRYPSAVGSSLSLPLSFWINLDKNKGLTLCHNTQFLIYGGYYVFKGCFISSLLDSPDFCLFC